MSLINKMLQDLENRSEGPVLEQQEVLHGLGSTGQAVIPAPKKTSGLVLVFILVLSILCAFLLFERSGMLVPPDKLAVVEKTEAEQPPEQKPIVSQALPVESAVEEKVQANALAESQEEPSHQVYELLPAANKPGQAESEGGNVPGPVETDAVKPLEQEVLAEEPVLLDEKIYQGTLSLESGLNSEAELADMLVDDNSAASMHWDALRPASTPASESSRQQAGLDENQKREKPLRVDRPAPRVALQSDVAVQPGERLFSRQPAKKGNSELAIEHYQKAVIQLRRRKQNQAIDSLKLAIELDSKLTDARILLATQLLAQGNAWEAEKIFVSGLQEMPDDSALAYAYARILVGQGKLSGALNILNRAQPRLEINPEYHAFSAALLQRLEEHPAAIDKYSEVLRVRPGKGVWWMGLGISLLAEGQQQRALQAFQTALRDNSLTSNIRQYLSDRISVLQGATS